MKYIIITEFYWMSRFISKFPFSNVCDSLSISLLRTNLPRTLKLDFTFTPLFDSNNYKLICRLRFQNKIRHLAIGLTVQRIHILELKMKPAYF